MSHPKINTHTKILYAIIGATLCAILLRSLNMPQLQLQLTEITTVIGNIFLKLLKLCITPVIFTSVFSVFFNAGNLQDVGHLGKYALVLYLLSTLVAIITGLLLVNSAFAGDDFSAFIQQFNYKTSAIAIPSFSQMFGDIIPDNPIKAFIEGNLIQVVFLAVVFGIATNRLKVKAAIFGTLVIQTQAMITYILNAIMQMAPLFLFFLIFSKVVSIDMSTIVLIGKYFAVVVVGIILHCTINISMMLLAAKQSPIRFVRQYWPVILTAWSTCSSSASLPMAMQALQQAKVNPKTASFVMPIGVVLNMNGTALYDVVTIVFITKLLGLPFDLFQQITISIMSVVAAIGTAGLPGAAIMNIGMCLTALNLPLDTIGVIIGVERFLDQIRTAANIYVDLAVTVVINKIYKPSGLTSVSNDSVSNHSGSNDAGGMVSNGGYSNVTKVTTINFEQDPQSDNIMGGTIQDNTHGQAFPSTQSKR